MVNRTELLILNAAADDPENLEQIYRAVSLEFSPENYEPDNPQAYYLRETRPPVPLADVADAVRSLAEKGLLRARTESGGPQSLQDLTYVWRAWFELTPAGRKQLAESQAELSAATTDN